MDSTDLKPAESGNAIAPAPPKTRRRWFQFRLRTLLYLVGLCAVAAFLWRTLAEALPYRDQRRTMALVEQLGGTYQTADASSWHRRLFGSDLQNLVLVNLADCDKADDYIVPVAGSPLLETLIVGGASFGDDHLRRLQHSPSLRHLVLDSTSVTDDALADLRATQPRIEVHWSERRAIASLEKLGYVTTRPGAVPPPLQAALPKDYFDAFYTGCFSQKCDDASLRNVRCLRNANKLILSGTQITDRGLSCLSNAKTLQVIDLSSARITDAGVAHLAGLHSLEELQLTDTAITDKALPHLQGLSKLRTLDLSYTQISDNGLVCLKGLTRLETLELDGNRLTNAAVQDLRKALPKCDISHRP